MALIFDIETVGHDFEALGEVTRANLTRWIKRQAGTDKGKYQAALTDLKEGLGFSPLTGEIVAIGVFDTVKNKGVVYFQSPAAESEEWRDGSFTFKPKTEKEMITAFWQGVSKYNTFVSFNGRSFDVPFILIRGAKYKIKPSKNLMANRYLRFQQSAVKHIDLFDQLSFYGAVRRRGNLHLYCQALGIRSPKASGITGDDVGGLFKNKKYKEIAEYNSWDLVATTELYEKWRKYIST
ncbi:ribonuclease H-like domain-containing protein [Candidatus Parcubacteria bacterium]|nr:ribonuclease H-like domain-containing protein [Candidatus Parcubacteria bacterium]